MSLDAYERGLIVAQCLPLVELQVNKTSQQPYMLQSHANEPDRKAVKAITKLITPLSFRFLNLKGMQIICWT